MENKEKQFDLIETMFLYSGVILLINTIVSGIVGWVIQTNPFNIMDTLLFIEIGLFLIFSGCMFSGDLKREHRGEEIELNKYSAGVKYLVFALVLFVFEIVIGFFFYTP